MLSASISCVVTHGKEFSASFWRALIPSSTQTKGTVGSLFRDNGSSPEDLLVSAELPSLSGQALPARVPPVAAESATWGQRPRCPFTVGRDPEAEAAPWLYLVNRTQCLVTFVAKDRIRCLFGHQIRFRLGLLCLTQRIFISHADIPAHVSGFPREEGSAASSRNSEPPSSVWASALLCPLPIRCLRLGQQDGAGLGAATRPPVVTSPSLFWAGLSLSFF